MKEQVELTKRTLELRYGLGVTIDQSIRTIAEREAFLQSPTEKQWRNNLKVGDFCYCEDDAGFHLSTHCYRVTKVTKNRIYILGYWWVRIIAGLKKGESATGKVENEYWIDTGRPSRKGFNPSFAISSRTVYANSHHERGLEEQEFKQRLNDYASKTPWAKDIEPDFLEKAWEVYKNNEILIGFRKK